MEDNTIHNLREALKLSPDNVPLKQHLAEVLIKAGRYDEAEVEYAALVKSLGDHRSKLGLSNVFYLKGEYSKCNVILEECLDRKPDDFDALILHARALLKERSTNDALKVYQKALSINPLFSDAELDGSLRVKSFAGEDPEELETDERFIQKLAINFAHVGGMDHVKNEIDLKIIKPLQHQELYKAYGKKTGGGILLYGPPGCGKTFIAKATAGQINARFISVGLSDILDMWIGNSEKNLHEVFELARQNTPCVLFIDEIDALGASRSDMKQSAGRHLINQFLQELDGISSNNDGILVLGATNAPWHLDPAFRRPGRFDRIIFVPPPDEAARASIFQLKLRNMPTEALDYPQLAKRSENYSGADIEAIVDIAVESKLQESFTDGVPKPIATSDLAAAIKKHRPSIQEWFTTAKNFALYANESGLYDDILVHLKIKK